MGINPFNNDNLHAATLPKTMGYKNPDQQELPLGIAKQIEIDGIGMGVLSDGTAFLTGYHKLLLLDKRQKK